MNVFKLEYFLENYTRENTGILESDGSLIIEPSSDYWKSYQSDIAEAEQNANIKQSAFKAYIDQFYTDLSLEEAAKQYDRLIKETRKKLRQQPHNREKLQLYERKRKELSQEAELIINSRLTEEITAKYAEHQIYLKTDELNEEWIKGVKYHIVDPKKLIAFIAIQNELTGISDYAAVYEPAITQEAKEIYNEVQEATDLVQDYYTIEQINLQSIRLKPYRVHESEFCERVSKAIGLTNLHEKKNPLSFQDSLQYDLDHMTAEDKKSQKSFNAWLNSKISDEEICKAEKIASISQISAPRLAYWSEVNREEITDQRLKEVYGTNQLKATDIKLFRDTNTYIRFLKKKAQENPEAF